MVSFLIRASFSVVVLIRGRCLLDFGGFRNSRPEVLVFCRKDALGSFAKFTEKHLCQSLFFNKVAGLRPAILLKKSLWHGCFPVNFAKFLRTLFFYRTPPVAASKAYFDLSEKR